MKKYDAYAIKCNEPFITKSIPKRKKPSEGYLRRKKFFDTHDISVRIDPITKEPIVKATLKDV